jgi:protein-S-isoprenylcysteine O-methyltransferase Ste14
MSGLPSLGPRGEGWVLIQVVLFPLVGLAGLTGPAWSGSLRTATDVLGIVLLAAGIGLGAWGLVALQSALTPLPRPRDGAELVESGAYRLVRHPIYGGIIVAALGYGLLMAAPLAILGAVGLLGFFRLKSAREEVWLMAVYPEYAAYRARTPRLLPFVY